MLGFIGFCCCYLTDVNSVEKPILSMSLQMKNGTLMAAALHLFLTQLEPAG